MIDPTHPCGRCLHPTFYFLPVEIRDRTVFEERCTSCNELHGVNGNLPKEIMAG